MIASQRSWLAQLWRRHGALVAALVAALGVLVAVAFEAPLPGSDAGGPATTTTSPAGPAPTDVVPGGEPVPTAVPGEQLPGVVGGVPVEPYIDPAFLGIGQRDLSFTVQPWRGYLETVPATQFLDGLGVFYNLPDNADNAAAAQALALAGFRSARLEVSWAQIGSDDQLQPTRREQLRSVLGAFRDNGIRPLILLNANHGDPGPHEETTRTVVASASAGDRSVVLNDVSGLVVGRSGLSDVEQGDPMAGTLITSIGIGGTVQLSRPLSVDVRSGTTVTIDTLQYSPLYPVDQPEFARTADGWLRYVDAVLREVDSFGLPAYDVEIWNELTFGSKFLDIDQYYDPPLFDGTGGVAQPGAPAWELARRTVDAVHGSHPAATVIWGFSSTNFFGVPIADLPPGIDGQSYHPYHTQTYAVPGDFPEPDQEGRFASVPQFEMTMPEGRAQLAVQDARLTTLLNPTARLENRPPGTAFFGHYITEHGFAPTQAGVTDVDLGRQLEARAVLRATTFWLNKGILRMEYSSAWKREELENGLLPASDPSDWGGVPTEELMTPALRAMRNLTGAFAGAVPLSTVRQLGIHVSALGDQPEAFPGMPYREMFTALPFQVDPNRFVVALYVMGFDLVAPPPSMTFAVTITGVDGAGATVDYVDPLDGASVPVSVLSRTADSVTVSVDVTDSPRLLHLGG